ncbi:hypothetical protein EBR96_00610 [bacterium]|nr:hypothetical protein [bacterium]
MYRDSSDRIIVIGGLSAGPSAAARARRINPDAEILLFEKDTEISYATCGIPYAISGEIQSIDSLRIVSPGLLHRRFGIELHLNEEVTGILPDRHEIETPKGRYRYNKLIYAAGASPVVPPFPGLDSAKNWSSVRTLADTQRIISGISEPELKSVTVLGGGLIGMEMADNLRALNLEVTLIEGGPQLLSPWSQGFGHYAKEIAETNGVRVITGSKVTGLKSVNNQITAVSLDNGTEVETEYLIVAIGVRPNTQLLRNLGAATIPNGALVVNSQMETSIPDIFAAGDCIAVTDLITEQPAYYPLGSHSNKCGRIAGTNAAGGNAAFKGAIGTAVLKLFGYTFARTGINPDTYNGPLSVKIAEIITAATASYYPHSESIWLKVSYDADTGKVLGADAAGKIGVDKRIDVIATAIYAGLTIDDLGELDLAYAPPYAPAKDPVIISGFVAQNEQKGLFVSRSPIMASIEMSGHPCHIIDLRSASERKQFGTIPNAVPIPLDQIDTADIDPDLHYFVYCQKGLRGYLACLRLIKRGCTHVVNIAGGFEGWVNSGLPVSAVPDLSVDGLVG